MRKFFSRNLETRGRLVRGSLGVALIVAGFLVSEPDGWVCVLLVASGCFVLYEAVRGWCVMRACGIRTPL
jgi:hypothetical protein